ncbi:hypothetical protein SK854_13610 [Lentzea sp. BCCO 10_0061]|uniref:Uncharacterized protein n=1 Tax=Lentzea sokolovensis TaxID=3095429 RepID=A0ABU4UUH9_9PSEU|nr:MULTISPECIES: hypothetical protein [Lentzea]MDX8143159.1 hypothetical protein [Lentzea sp. BCCO 10_0061]
MAAAARLLVLSIVLKLLNGAGLAATLVVQPRSDQLSSLPPTL